MKKQACTKRKTPPNSTLEVFIPSRSQPRCIRNLHKLKPLHLVFVDLDERAFAVANALSWAKNELKSFLQPVAGTTCLDRLNKSNKNPYSLAVTNSQARETSKHNKTQAFLSKSRQPELNVDVTEHALLPGAPIRVARVLPPHRGSCPVNTRVKSARRAQACRHSHQILGLAVQDAETKQHFTTNYREVYFDEPCWVQRCVFYSVWFYALSKPRFWVMCIFVDVIFVSQEMHCKKGTGYFRRSRICLSIQ